MATKNEIVSYLQSNFNVTEVDDLVVTINVGWNDGRSQIVFVGINEGGYLTISSPVGAIADINLDSVLSWLSNHSMPWGIRASGEFLVVANVGFTDTTDAVELDVPIQQIAEAADELEKALHGKDIF